MALSSEQLRRVRSYVGDDFEDDDINEIYDDLESLDHTVLELLRRQLALLLDQPASASVEGAVSYSNAENIRALREAIKDFSGGLDDEELGSIGFSVTRITRPSIR